MWMSPVRKCGWLDMENTKLVSGEIQHSSSKKRKCERLGLTNAKGPNQEIQISAATNPISSKANQSKLCEGSRSVICHMLHVTCIYWIITLTEKMMVHNHFDDQIMSKLSIRSTSWPNCQVAHKIVKWRIKWSIKWRIDFDIPLISSLSSSQFLSFSSLTLSVRGASHTFKWGGVVSDLMQQRLCASSS